MTIALLVLALVGQATPVRAGTDPQVLLNAGKWSEILRDFPPSSDDTPEIRFTRGIAHARLQQWDAARTEFETGQRIAPGDARFPIELAGVAFRQGRTGEARHLLQHALRLRPGDPYALDFLATLHLLDGNTRAALQAWNTLGKPRIEIVRMVPEPRLDPVVLDRALVVRPGTVALLGDYDSSLNRLDLMDLFGLRALELIPRPDGDFDMELRSAGKTGVGNGRLSTLAGFLRGLPYSTVYPEFYSMRRSGLNLTSLARWDPRKRRFSASLSGPVSGDPAKRVQIDLDLRDEEWDAEIGRFSMRKIETGASLTFAPGTWRIRTGGFFAARGFGEIDVQPMDRSYLRDGPSLAYRFGVDGPLLSVPRRRFEAPLKAVVQAARVFGEFGGTYARLAGGIQPHWYPLARGDDFGMTGRIQAGGAAGAVPVDELFSFGLERDNALVMRGHRGTADGRKGAGPLGTLFFLGSWELEKKLAGNELWRISAGPFVDTGRMWDREQGLGSTKWLTDVGLQSKVTILKVVSLTFSYGTDLRSGAHVFHFTTSSP